ncbi:DUF488 family protein, partial [Clostridium perfringens]|uniref:hypothetical protein n=1 Tax=Clostridium perfringens TaxID=1502 RepID=UPI003754B2DB
GFTKFIPEDAMNNIEKGGVNLKDIDFKKVIEEIENGIERLKLGISKGYRIALLGAMQEPVRCHRSILVGRELEKYGFKVNHILHDYSICDQREIENMLLDKYFKDRGQITIDSLIGNEKSEDEMIEEGYDLANKEIGYRMEKLK